MGGEDRKSWCIVGGGALGLTLALRLAQQGQKVTVLEASPNLGGLADAWEIGGIQWDRHYHVILLSDLHLRGLLDELGLGDTLQWQTTLTDFYDGQRFYPMNNAIDYLRFPLLNTLDKVRLAGTILYASHLEDGRALEAVPLRDWLVRFSGRRTYEQIWLPLLRAKLGDNHERASAAFIWAIIRRLYAARRSGLKTEKFGYAKGGYARIFERFRIALERQGVICRTSCHVHEVRSTADGLRVGTDNGAETYDRVVITTAAPIAARICPQLGPSERSALSSVLYQGIVCASVLIRKPLRNRYITYITDNAVPFTAVIDMSAIVGRHDFGGNTLVYLPCYVASDDPLFNLSDADVEQRFLGGLMRVYPDLTREDVIAFRVSRVRHVLAISTLNYSDYLPPMQTSVDGLQIVNSAHIVNGTLNVNETVKLAEETVPWLLDSARNSTKTKATA